VAPGIEGKIPGMISKQGGTLHFVDVRYETKNRIKVISNYNNNSSQHDPDYAGFEEM